MAKSKVRWNKRTGLSRKMTAGSKRVTVRRRAKAEIFKGKDDLWYFRLRAGNGEIIASSEGYTRRYTATLGARRVLAAS